MNIPLERLDKKRRGLREQAALAEVQPRGLITTIPDSITAATITNTPLITGIAVIITVVAVVVDIIEDIFQIQIAVEQTNIKK